MSVTVSAEYPDLRIDGDAVSITLSASQGAAGGTTGPWAVATNVRTLAAGTYCVTPYVEKAGTLTAYRRLKATGTGTFTLTVQKNGVDVTGLASLAVTGTAQSPTASTAIAVGDRIDVVISALTGSPGLEGSLAGIWT